MVSEHSKYLRLFDAHGNWIERPDLMVLAAISEPNEIDVEHTYASMVFEEKENPSPTKDEMSKFARNVERRTIRGNLTQRILAGSVVLELARLAFSTGKSQPINAARRLVAFNYQRYTGKNSPENMQREVEKALSQYRDTMHLQAAVVYYQERIVEMEGDEQGLRRFLGIARAFEEFIDANPASEAFRWSPWRIPTQIVTRPKIEFFPSTDQELAAANAM
jgi:hypothetical protein